jgi:hypothetical protein
MTVSSALGQRLQSVVLHRAIDDDTALKVACAPLEIEEYPALLAGGTGTPFVAAAERGLDDIQALGSLRRALDGTTRVRVSAIGLGAEIEYPVHVHSLPCGFDDGGPHYKIDVEEAGRQAEHRQASDATAV